MNTAQILAARWNATYPPGTPVTVTLAEVPPFDAITQSPAAADAKLHVSPTHKARVPVGDGSFAHVGTGSVLEVALSCIEHRTVLPPDAAQAMRALGIPPLCEMDPAPLLDLHDLPGWMQSDTSEYEDRWLTIPHAIAGYIAKLAAPPTEDQTEHIERHIAAYHGLPPAVWKDGLPWHYNTVTRRLCRVELPPGEYVKAHWYVRFTFAHRFITGTAQLCHLP